MSTIFHLFHMNLGTATSSDDIADPHRRVTCPILDTAFHHRMNLQVVFGTVVPVMIPRWRIRMRIGVQWRIRMGIGFHWIMVRRKNLTIPRNVPDPGPGTRERPSHRVRHVPDPSHGRSQRVRQMADPDGVRNRNYHRVRHMANPHRLNNIIVGTSPIVQGTSPSYSVSAAEIQAEIPVKPR